MRELTRDEYQERRRKEYLAFLVVKFLKARVAFDELYRQFKQVEAAGTGLGGSGLFERVRRLEEELAFDIKEKAHVLFRADGRGATEGRRAAPRLSRRALRDLKASLETRSIDANIGTGYHLLAILKESLYQLERYAPAYARDRQEVEQLEQMARRLGYTFSEEEQRELRHLRELAETSLQLAAETEAMARRMMARCQALFRDTAEVILRFIEAADQNEVLVQNLLRQRALLETVYGPGSSERIFFELSRGRDVRGATGLERALDLARRHCGNCDGLPGRA